MSDVLEPMDIEFGPIRQARVVKMKVHKLPDGSYVALFEDRSEMLHLTGRSFEEIEAKVLAEVRGVSSIRRDMSITIG